MNQGPNAQHPQPATLPASQSNGRASFDGTFARQARAVLSALPSKLETRVKLTPYAAIGAAFAVGIATGVLFSSRLVRAVLVTVAASAVAAAGAALMRRAANEPPKA